MTTRINVAICTPTTGMVKATYAASLLHMVGHYMNTPVKTILDGDIQQMVSYNLLIGSNPPQQYDELVDDALRDPTTTHMLFLEDDHGFRSECLNDALEREADVLLANYRRKTSPWPFTARKVDDQNRAVEVVTDDMTHGLERVTFGGFGFCLIRRHVLEKMKKPRFLNVWIDHQELVSTGDYPFFKQINDLGIPVYVDHDLSKKITHIGDFAYRWESAPFGVRVKREMSPVPVQEYKAA